MLFSLTHFRKIDSVKNPFLSLSLPPPCMHLLKMTSYSYMHELIVISGLEGMMMALQACRVDRAICIFDSDRPEETVRKVSRCHEVPRYCNSSIVASSDHCCCCCHRVDDCCTHMKQYIYLYIYRG